jgi:hypothetical protein
VAFQGLGSFKIQNLKFKILSGGLLKLGPGVVAGGDDGKEHEEMLSVGF